MSTTKKNCCITYYFSTLTKNDTKFPFCDIKNKKSEKVTWLKNPTD